MVLAPFVAAMVIVRISPIAAADVALAGTWTLNRSLSQIPAEIGFTVVGVPAGRGGQGAPGGGRGGRGRGGGGGGGQASGRAAPFAGPRESYEDSQRRQFLTDEARTPSSRLTISEADGMFTIVDEIGRPRTLSATDGHQSLEMFKVPVPVSTTNLDGRYIVIYDVSTERQVRYIYSRRDDPPQLIVDIDLIERNRVGDKAHLVYEPSKPGSTGAIAAGGAGAAGADGAVARGGANTGSVPTATGRPPEVFDQRSGAELRGLTSLGVVVEELGAQAKSCGLDQGAIETAVSKRLTAGGFTVERNTDDDTYLYVNIKTDRLPDGTCLSRYDSSIYTHTTARLSYGASAALVQVELMHRGGLSATTGAHAPAVIQRIESDLDLFVTQIRTANR